MKRSVLLIGNPGAGSYSGKKLDKAITLLLSSGATLEVFLTKKKGDAETRAQEAVEEQPALVVVAGGDGTINDVANGLALSDIPVGILPMGNANVLSREVGISTAVENALNQILNGSKHSISLGKIETVATKNARYFLLMADIGYGGSTVHDLNTKIKRFSARGAFILSGAKNLLKNHRDRLLFDIDGTQYAGYHAIIGNISRYGGDFRVTPDAQLECPELFICIFEGGKRIDLAKYVFGVVTGQHRLFKDVVYRKCRNVLVEGDADIQLDGNYFGKSPVKIDVIRNALRLVY